MHILFIPSWYSTPENPIAGCFFKDQAVALSRAGHKVGVLVAPQLRSLSQLHRARRPSDFSTRRSFESEGGVWTSKTSQWGWFPGPVAPKLKARWISFLARDSIQSYLAEEGPPDVIHAHCVLYGGMLAAQIKASLEIPAVLTEHSTAYFARLIRKRDLPLIKSVLLSMDRLLALGPSLRSSLREILPELEVGVLGEMVDTDFFRPSEISKADDHFLLAAVGVLLKRKGIDRLLQAFSKAFPGRQKVRLVIGGNGPERCRLQELAGELGLRERVSFPGLMKREQVRELFQQAHVVVSASNTETFGVTLIEAMACGTPVVATRSGGPEFFVNERNGVVAESGVKELAEALIQVRSRLDSYDAARIRTECKDRFSEPAICGRLETVYREVIEESGSAAKGSN